MMFPWQKKAADTVNAMRETQEAYRRVFSSADGRKVLTHMLTELHFFDEVVTDSELALSNYARRILYYLGVISAQSLERGTLIDSMMFKVHLAPKKEQQKADGQMV
jgi:hypothetical protein